MPRNTTAEQIAKDAITTSVVTSGILQDYQAKKFLMQTFDATPFQKAIRHEMRTEKSGEIDKIGIGSRLLRPKVENEFDGVTRTPRFGSIHYETTPTRLDWDITNDTLRQNIEGEDMDAKVTDLMATQTGVDTEDLLLNGDEKAKSAEAFAATANYASGDFCTKDDVLYRFTKAHNAAAWSDADVEIMGAAEDTVFLGQNDGVIKLLKAGHVVDLDGATSMTLDMFYQAVAAIPNRFNNGRLRWMMSPTRAQQWELFLLNKVIDAGGAVPESLYKSPVGIPTLEVPKLDNGTIILGDPLNFIQVNTYNVKIRKDDSSVEAIRKDKRFYVIHFDFDAMVEEVEATAIMTNLPALFQ